MATHPYFPKGLTLEGYEEQVMGTDVILGVFFAATLVLITVAWWSGRHLCTSERIISAWMLATGAIHLIVEGSFSLYPDFYKNTDPYMLLLEIWKEYSKADSRYATRDSFVTSMETITAFAVGPASFLVFWGLVSKANWRWTLLTMVSVAQLYGDVLYFATCWLEGGVHVRPEPLYFWFYFIFMNGIWIVLPIWCILYAWQRINTSMALAESGHKSKTS